MNKIKAYAINLVKRTDRKASIFSEFADKDEFQLNLVQAIEHPIGAIGLWQALRGIVERVSEEDFDSIIICEDDHTFTSHTLIRSQRRLQMLNNFTPVCLWAE